MSPNVYSGRNMHSKVFNCLSKNGPDFKIGQADHDDLKNFAYRCAQVFTQAETGILRF